MDAPSTTQAGRFRPTHLVVHYNEVALKGRNRLWFEATLVRNIRRALTARLQEEGSAFRPRVSRLYGRILVDLGGAEAHWRTIVGALCRVFGVAYVLPVVRIELPDLESIKNVAAGILPDPTAARTFAVKCRRSTKEFPFDSMDVQSVVGAHVQGITGWSVDLEQPDCVLRIECVNKVAFVGLERFQGPGGMPTGVTPRVACLISGGIDSPVAAYRILRRGAPPLFIHFHSHPHTGRESQEKVKDLAGRILPLGTKATLYLVPFAELQRAIAARCAAPLRVLLYRRFMLRVAETIAHRDGALALVTGENLGQVASQTLENILAIDQVVTLPVLRPLIGLDKQEIIGEAKRIGTFLTSIEPHGDCCSFLMPANPATHSTDAELSAQESCFDVPAEVARLVDASEVVTVNARMENPSLEHREDGVLREDAARPSPDSR